MSLMDLLGEEDQIFSDFYPDVGEYEKSKNLPWKRKCWDLRQWTSLITGWYRPPERSVTAPLLILWSMKKQERQRFTIGESAHWWSDQEMSVKLTKKNQNMAFITLEDLRGTVEVVVFQDSMRHISLFKRRCQSIYQRTTQISGRRKQKLSVIRSSVLRIADKNYGYNLQIKKHF